MECSWKDVGVNCNSEQVFFYVTKIHHTVPGEHKYLV